VLDVAILGLGVFTAYKVERASSSTSPPVTAGKADDGLQDKADNNVRNVDVVFQNASMFALVVFTFN
jgi:hypothetical protein